MCGLFGIANFSNQKLSEVDLEKARAASGELRHRGPDQYGEWVSNNVYIGHRRLSILDLSESGKQPMVSFDGRVAVAVNGEIYNFRQLRNELGTHLFRSMSDSEVVLHGYEAWGIEGLLLRIEGMFAFCILDNRVHKLYLARDHIGIKPLYFGQIENHIFWSSELKAIKRFFSPRSLQVDNTALYDFLTYRYIPTPKTLYKNCKKLEPAHYVQVNLCNVKVSKHQYWQIPVSEDGKYTLDTATEELRGLLRASVEDQLASDVPVGFFLSGGMDSSVVVFEATRCHENISTYSIGYDDLKHDETSFAQQVADYCGTRHQQRILKKGAEENLLEMMEWLYDEPFADTSALPTHHVSTLAKDTVTVVLTGDGGDELFGGYRWYERFRQFRRLQSFLGTCGGRGLRTQLADGRTGLPRKLFSRLDLWTRFDPLDLYATLLSGYIDVEKKAFRAELGIDPSYDDLWHFRRYYRLDLPMRKRLQYLDFHTYLPDDILTKVDRATMSVSLEARVPLLSRELTEFAFRLPESVLYPKNQLKGLLKYAYQDSLPVSIIEREKKGFSIPIHCWDSSLNEDVRIVQQRIFERYRPLN